MLLNEYELAEEFLSSKKQPTKSDLMIIAKYLRNEMNCDVNQTLAMLTTIMFRINRNFNPIKSAKYLERLAIKANGVPLKKVEYVRVTSNELGSISNLDNPKLQRILFVLLIYAKFNNIISDKNNNWCNIKINEIYRSAKVSTRNANEKGILLNRLSKMDYISFSVHNTNLNIKCDIVDTSNDYEDSIKITDLRELGYQYISLTNPEQFTYCENCGAIIRKKSKKDHSTKLCNYCLRTIRNENNLNWFYNLDKADPLQTQ